MKKTTSIALKLFALYLIFSVLVSLPTIVASSWHIANMGEGQPAPAVYAAMIIIPTVALAAFAIWLLWKTANSIAPKEETRSSDTTTMDLDTLFRYAISLMGFFFAVTSLLSLPGQWLNLKMSHGPSVISTYSVSFGAIIVRLLLGCFLIARPQQWVAWLKRIGEIKDSQQSP